MHSNCYTGSVCTGQYIQCRNGWKAADILHQQHYTAVFVEGEVKSSKLNCCKI